MADSYWERLRRVLKESFVLEEEPLKLIGTSDLLLAQSTATSLAWALWNGPAYLLMRIRELSNLDSQFDYSDSEVVGELVGFAFDLGQLVEPVGLGHIAKSLSELASVRLRPARIGIEKGASATDALASLTLRLADRMQSCYGQSRLLDLIQKVLPESLDPDGSMISEVLKEAVRARWLEAAGKEHQGFKEVGRWRLRDLEKGEVEQWTTFFDRLRLHTDLLLDYHWQDLFSIIEPMRVILRGYRIGSVVAELDLEFGCAARARKAADIPLTATRPSIEGSETVEVSREWQALAFLKEHPNWSCNRIAEAIGVSRTTLYTWPNFVAARRALRAGKSRLPRGWKNPDGDVEAWDNDS